MKQRLALVLGLSVLLSACDQQRSPRAVDELVCSASFTPIHEIQGTGRNSPLVGRVLETEGVVIANFSRGLGGVFIQSPAGTLAPAQASSGLFVEHQAGEGGSSLHGALVRVRGEVAELGPAGNSLTSLISVSKFRICEASAETGWVELDAAPGDWERYEGMRVRITKPLTVIDTWGLDRFASMDLAFGGRQWIPTERHEPGREARALAERNQSLRLRVDDGNLAINPETVWYLGEQPAPRLGSLFGGIEGVVDQREGDYRLHLLSALELVEAAPRPDSVPEVPGALRLVNFNVENYFNGDGRGGGFPTPRGAETAAAFQRQREKILAAMRALDGDLYGLIELENDGFGPDSAIADLLAGLNEGNDVYAMVDAGVERVGGDAITVGMIYRRDRLRASGPAAMREGTPFDSLHRVPLAQAFEDLASGQVFTVVVNHFKSKGSCPRSGDAANEDRGDGQACWNAARVQAAQALAEWMATDPTGSGSTHAVIMGDLNAYANEDPLRLLRGRGWTHVKPGGDWGGESDYSYVFRGEQGSLDHTLVSPSLVPAVSGVAVWGINADEPRYLEYGRIDSIEEARGNPWRSSDHNPQIVGLDLERLP